MITLVQHPDTLYDDLYVRETIDISGYRSLGGLQSTVSADETGITGRLGRHCFRFETWAPGVMRLRFAPDAHLPPTSTTEELGLLLNGVSGAPLDWSYEEPLLRFRDGLISVVFNTATADFEVRDAAGDCLLRSRNGGFRFADGAPDVGPAYFAEFERLEEAYFGFGGRIMKPDRTGHTADVFSVKTGKRSGDYGGFPLPYFISTRGYGLFLNNPWPHVYFDMGQTRRDSWFVHAPGGDCDLFVLAGPEFPDVIRRFTDMVGRIRTPVRWLLGFWCSSLGFASADQAIADARRLREERYPCDVFVFDGPWRSGRNFISVYAEGQDYPSCDFGWHPDFGDGPGMVRRLAELGIKTGLHINSRSFSPETAEDGLSRGLLRRQGKEVVPRVGVPEAETYYASLLVPRVAENIALWWTDHSDRVSGELAPGIPSRNLLGPLWNRLISSLMPNRDLSYPLSLSRGGGIGSQRFALPWPGDTRCGVDALIDDIWFMINAGLSGFPLTSVDLGGFAVRGEPLEDYAGPADRDAEMFADENIARRVCQAILYVPLPRIHNNWETTAKFPWHCSETLRPLYRQALEERYRLTPYWFSYAL
ncbi:MAG: TIM-barrel domain-containing protein, partial [Anaerolineae bacterium]